MLMVVKTKGSCFNLSRFIDLSGVNLAPFIAAFEVTPLILLLSCFLLSSVFDDGGCLLAFLFKGRIECIS